MSLARRKIISGSGTQNLPRLSDAGDVAVAEVSRNGVVLDINDLGRQLLGWKKNDRLAAPVTSALKMLPDGRPMRLPIGREGVYVVGVSKGIDKSCLLFGFHSDDLRKSSTFEQLVDRIPVAITRTDWHGVVSFANRYARKIIGKDSSSTPSWRNVILSADQWKLDEAFEILSREGFASTRVRYEDHDGVQRSAILYLYAADANADFVEIAGVDSSEEPPLAPEQADDTSYRTLVEQSPVGIVHLDAQGRIVMENHPFRQIIGELPEDSWIGQHYSTVADLDDGFIATVTAMLDDGIAFAMEDVKFRSSTGDYILTLRGSPIIQEDGIVKGGVVIVEDRTRQKAAEKIIEDAKNEAIESAARKSAFISTMSHELRTPLGTIKGYAELLNDEIEALSKQGEIPEVLHEFATTIRDRSENVLAIVDNLFDMALLDSGLISLDCAVVDIDRVIERVAIAMFDKFRRKGIQLLIEHPEQLPRIEGDEHRLEQVLQILVDNALKFTPEGSVSVKAFVENEKLIISIIDTGIGIDEEYLDSLFKPMIQGDSRLNREYDGAGIGLAMVERVIRQMNGQITVQNGPEGGSIFKLTLPLSCQESEA